LSLTYRTICSGRISYAAKYHFENRESQERTIFCFDISSKKKHIFKGRKSPFAYNLLCNFITHLCPSVNMTRDLLKNITLGEHAFFYFILFVSTATCCKSKAHKKTMRTMKTLYYEFLCQTRFNKSNFYVKGLCPHVGAISYVKCNP